MAELKWNNGDCGRCGAHDVLVATVGYTDTVCKSCLEEYYIYCPCCEEYWDSEMYDFVEAKDGRILCSECAGTL